MAEPNIPPNVVAFKRDTKPRRISADVVVLADGADAGRLSPTERLVASYAITERSARKLALGPSLVEGHRIALMTHFNSLMVNQGEEVARHMAAVLCGMVGCECIPHGIDPGVGDETDWSGVALK